MKPGDVVVGMLEGAAETNVRTAVVIASGPYLLERPDVLVGILTTKLPRLAASTDHVLLDWGRWATGPIVFPGIHADDSPLGVDCDRSLD